MKVTYPKNKLIEYLNYAENIARSKSIIPILSNILIDASDNELKLSSSNLETGIIIKDRIDILESGAIAVDGKKLIEITRELPDDDVILSTDEHERLIIESNSDKINAKFLISGLTKSDFPVIKENPDSNYIQIDADVFKDMIRRVIFSISNDENKYTLTGIFLEKVGDCVNLVATDGKRLSLVKKKRSDIGINMSEINLPEEGILIPKIVLTEILKYSFKSKKLFVGFSKNQIFFMYDNINITSNFIEGKFPDYKRVIPGEREKYFIIEKCLLLNAIKRVSILADESYNQIKLSILKDKLIVSSKNKSLCEAIEEIPINYSGEDIDFAINYVYLIDILKTLDSSMIKIDFVNSFKAITIKGENEKNYINLIMPLKINL